MQPLVYGYHGKDNFGDDLFVDVMEADGKSILGAKRLSLIRSSRRPEGLLARAWWEATSGGSRLGSLLRATEFFVRACLARHVSFSGGSLFSAPSGNYLIVWVLMKIGICKVSAYGVSVGPVSVGGWRRRILRDLVEECDPLLVRDDASVERLPALVEGKEVVLAGDLAALSRRVEGTVHEGQDSRYVLFIPCRSSGDIEAKAEWVARALSPGSRLVVLSVNSNRDEGDDVVVDRIASSLSSIGFRVDVFYYEEQGIDGVCSLIAGASFVVSSRLHGAIVSYLLERPFVMDSYEAKCDDFAFSVGLDPARLLSASSTEADWTTALSLVNSDGGVGVCFSATDYKNRAASTYLGSP